MAVDMLTAQAHEQLHCMQNSAGFWVTRRNTHVVRRPWCLSGCQELDPGRRDVIPFAG
jgi:hypothetical protein